ncbi:hypothetical protein HMPREF2736_02800 [Corynebacterium sp. HMSC036E10]|uniref:TRAP transporter small permease n=1 Tax=Corynebacterium TaxID=1716 RepID=UPI0008A8742D|nr:MULTISPECIES: TRAP transporter small permease [Corynebacterium]OHO31031.1 hypothetical protein HMPREF2656_10825 [Corynebacterium sp. HMSC034B08]OHO83340.1 hypothetical protein HMPREF2736_02800 [Corynebacterium sp. HMSC036E10]UBI09287.1 TRAP transporter small permease [Corynebacterium coyleae]
MSTASNAVAKPSKPVRKVTIEEKVGGAVLAVMTIVLFAQVFARFILGSSITWSEELARYLFIWLIFLMLGSVTLHGEQIAVDAFVNRLSGGARTVAGIFIIAICTVINVVLLVKGIELTYAQYDLQQQSAAMRLPMWLVYAALPVGMLIMVLRSIQLGVRIFKHEESSFSEPYGATEELLGIERED